MIAELAPGAELVASRRNLGYAAAVNRGAACMPGRDVLLLNPDVEAPEPTDVEALRAALASRPRAAVVAPSLLGHDGGVQYSARRFPSLAAMLGSTAAGRFGPLGRAYTRYVEPSQARRPIPVDWVIGAAMLIRRAAFDELCGWDERYFLYMEDADFCRRCARAGWEVWLIPDVQVVHGYARASSDPSASIVRSRARRRHVASLARFFAREPLMLAGARRR